LKKSRPFCAHACGRFKVFTSSHELPWVLEWLEKSRGSRTYEELALNLVERRESGEPLAYIFGEWVFRDLKIYVGPGVLIPRPETEELVDLSLTLIPDLKEKSSIRMADLGAGTGALGLGIAEELLRRVPLKSGEIFWIERSPVSFVYLEKNLLRYQKALAPLQLTAQLKDWTAWAAGTASASLDLLVANPPYVSQEDWAELDAGVKNFEPRDALVPDESTDRDPQALNAYLEILEICERLLKPGAPAAFEMGTQAEELWSILRDDPRFTSPHIHYDMAGKKRFVSLRRK
jgi:release factor glutamine methyltransferase